MHLLIRSIYSDSGPALLLGVFRTKELAETARREYLASVMHGGADPWEDGDPDNPRSSDADVIVRSNLDLIGCDAAIDRVFVVAASFYGQGEIIRGFLAITGSRAAAAEHAAKVAAENAGDDFFTGTEIVAVPIDTLSINPNGYHGERVRSKSP